MIEILLVVVIIGILAGAILRVINVKGVKGKTTDAVAKNQLVEIAKGVEAYYQLEGTYPADKSVMAKYVDVPNWPSSISYGIDGASPATYFTLSYLSSDGVSYIKYNAKWKRALEYCTVGGVNNDDCLGSNTSCAAFNETCASHGLVSCSIASTTCGCVSSCESGSEGPLPQ